MMKSIFMASAAALLLLMAPVSAQQDTKEQQGLRTATEHAVPAHAGRAEFYTVRPTDTRASDLIGMEVQNVANEDLGEIEDILVDDGKNIRGIVIGVGGFLGLGERSVAVTPGSVLIVKEQDGSEHAVVNATKETLTTAPEFRVEPRRG